MARSDPTRSDYSATRHLLRHLRHDRELRRNPLAYDAFATVSPDAALGTISSRVYSALRSMDAQPRSTQSLQHARHAAILLRVDVQRHDPARVATDLGLSIRQFYRERRAAHERFFDAYSCTIPAQSRNGDGRLPRQLIERAASLADSGEVPSAVSILIDVAANGDSGERCEALLQLSEIEAWGHRLDRARARAQEARAVLGAVSPSDGRYEDLCDTSVALDLLLRWFSLGPAAVRLTSADGRSPSSRPMARETVVRAAAALRNGEANDASSLLKRLRDGTEVLPTAVIVDGLMLQAEIADFVGEEESLSEALFGRAAAEAHAHGLRGRALYATHQLASTRWMHSRSPLDRSAYRSLVDGIDRSLPPRLRSDLVFSAADVEVAIGHPRRALQAARTAAAVSTNHYESLSAQGLAAGALLRLGRIADAGVQAAQAAELARREGHPRILSLAQRIQALSQFLQGKRREALAAIEESLECAKRFSSAHVIAQARAVREQISRR